MGKNIILLSDGTGNSAAKRHKTNVWRLYNALDLHRPDQIACYDDGVGSQEFKLFKLLGGVFVSTQKVMVENKKKFGTNSLYCDMNTIYENEFNATNHS